MALGAPWFSRSKPAPANWNATNQLLRANLLPVTASLSGPVKVVESVIEPQPQQRHNLDVTTSSPVVESYGHLVRNIRTAA